MNPNLKKFLLLNPRKFVMAIGVFIASVILHNLIYGLFNIEEAFFFIVAVFGVPIYFVIAIVFTLSTSLRRKKGAA